MSTKRRGGIEDVGAFIQWRIKSTFEEAIGAGDPKGLRALLLEDLRRMVHAPEAVNFGKHVFHALGPDAQVAAIDAAWQAWLKGSES
jgi:hypothetical protein